jgi:hypothetical protein
VGVTPIPRGGHSPDLASVLHAGEQTMHYPGQPGDTVNFLWDLSWVKQSIVEFQSNPFHTDYLYFRKVRTFICMP